MKTQPPWRIVGAYLAGGWLLLQIVDQLGTNAILAQMTVPGDRSQNLDQRPGVRLHHLGVQTLATGAHRGDRAA